MTEPTATPIQPSASLDDLEDTVATHHATYNYTGHEIVGPEISVAEPFVIAVAQSPAIEAPVDPNVFMKIKYRPIIEDDYQPSKTDVQPVKEKSRGLGLMADSRGLADLKGKQMSPVANRKSPNTKKRHATHGPSLSSKKRQPAHKLAPSSNKSTPYERQTGGATKIGNKQRKELSRVDSDEACSNSELETLPQRVARIRREKAATTNKQLPHGKHAGKASEIDDEQEKGPAQREIDKASSESESETLKERVARLKREKAARAEEQSTASSQSISPTRKSSDWRCAEDKKAVGAAIESKTPAASFAPSTSSTLRKRKRSYDTDDIEEESSPSLAQSITSRSTTSPSLRHSYPAESINIEKENSGTVKERERGPFNRVDGEYHHVDNQMEDDLDADVDRWLSDFFSGSPKYNEES
jgi:hypothetical protein